MPRALDENALNGYAKQWAVWYIQGYQTGNAETRKRDWLIQEFYNFTYKDEFEYLEARVRKHLTDEDLAEFNKEIAKLKKDSPRSDEVFAQELANRLAIDVNGSHIPGKIGTVQVGQRVVGKRVRPDGTMSAAKWPIYAGEAEERAGDSDIPDELPDPDKVYTELVPDGT